MRYVVATTALWSLALLYPASPAHAVAPSLGSIAPSGFQCGAEASASFTGARLNDAEELLFYSPGVQVLQLEAERDNLVKAQLRIGPDCRLGIHAVRVRTATGVSNLRTFTVGSLPEVAEKEPNNDFAAPQPVRLDCTISGVVLSEDVDLFEVEAKKGDRLIAEVEGLRLGYTFFDPHLAILNPDRFELAASDDSPLLRQDSLCAVVVPEDGRYVIQVRESAYGGSGACRYRLHVGRFPRPTAVYPAGGRPGQKLSIRWLGDPAGPWTEQVALPDAPTPLYALFARDESGMAPSPNAIRVVDLENTLEAEPNDRREAATEATAPGALNGVIQKAGDTDCFKFSAKKGTRYDIRVYARSVLRSPLDSVLTVRRASGAAVGSNDDSGGPDSYLRFTAPADEDYYVEIRDQLRSGGPDYVYRVEIAPLRPSLALSLPERQRYVSTTLAVPRGNRMALMVNAGRANWGGPLDVSFEGLPAGLSVQTVTMPGNRTTVPVLFSATADAPIAGALVDVIGRPVDSKRELVGHLRQRTMLVRGQNNRDVWGHDADRMAAAVTKEAPFALEIVQPHAPIARQGSKALKVVAQRRHGFDQPIAIRMLYNPPGIGSSGSITIPHGKSEATIPLTANSSAAIGAWPIVVTGSATVAGGRVEAATQMAQLEVSDSYFQFAFDKAAAELGQETELVVNVENKVPFDGEVEIRLLGLPANTSAMIESVKITKEAVQFVVPIKVAENARPGIYKSLVCRAVVAQNGEPVTHTLGGGELRIDKPLPPKGDGPKAAAQPQPVAAKPAPAKKRLSRLEQLRLARQTQTKKE